MQTNPVFLRSQGALNTLLLMFRGSAFPLQKKPLWRKWSRFASRLFQLPAISRKELEFVLLIQQHHYEWTTGNNASSSYVNSVNKTSDKHFTALNSSFLPLRAFQSLACNLINFIRAWVGQVKTNMTLHKKKHPSHEKSHSAYLLYVKTAPAVPSLRQQKLFHVSLTAITLQHFSGRKPCSQDDPGCMIIKAEMELMKQNDQISNFNVFSCNTVTNCKVWCCLISLSCQLLITLKFFRM